MPEAYWRAAGFHVAGNRAVRIDMLERLSDLIRERVSWRLGSEKAAPAGASGDGGFRVVGDLMSVVGCSGEEFASILKALGFKRERRKVEADAAAGAPPAATLEPATAAEEPAFEDIWRPRRRKEEQPRQARQAREKPDRKQHARGGDRKPPPAPQQERKQQRERARNIEHSPFAALKDMKFTSAPRRPEGS